MPSLKSQLLKRLKDAKRIVILGIGSPLRGDDALGVELAVQLKKNFKGQKNSRPLKIISCGTTPENFTGEIKRFKPSHIIIVDALDTQKEPGTVSVIDDFSGSVNVSFSTHSLPIQIFTDYLTQALGCQFFLIGIQPKTLEFHQPLSSEVKASIAEVVGVLGEIIFSEHKA